MSFSLLQPTSSSPRLPQAIEIKCIAQSGPKRRARPISWAWLSARSSDLGYDLASLTLLAPQEVAGQPDAGRAGSCTKLSFSQSSGLSSASRGHWPMRGPSQLDGRSFVQARGATRPLAPIWVSKPTRFFTNAKLRLRKGSHLLAYTTSPARSPP